MCVRCEILHLYDRFRSPLQYFHEMDKIRSLVEDGAMIVDSGIFPPEAISGGSCGFLRNELTCECGTRFAVWYDSAENSGGLCIIE